MLAHITPREAGILQALGGSGTINPQTGLPEFFRLRDIEKGIRQVGRSVDRAITQPVVRGLNSIAERLGPIGQIAAAYFGGPIGAGVYAGFAAPGGDFDLKKAAQAAVLTYGGQQLGQVMSAPGPMSPENAASYFGGPDGSFANIAPPPPGPSAMVDIPTMPVSDTLTAADLTKQGITLPPEATAPSATPSTSPGLTESEVIPRYSPGTSGPAPSFESSPPLPGDKPFTGPESAANLAGSTIDTITGGLKTIGIDTPMEYLAAGTIGTSLVQGARERDKFKEEQARVEAELAEKRRRYREQAEGILNMYPIRFAAEGGMMDEPDFGKEYDYAAGGMPPRFLSGGGDGMSDSIPATIADKQPARLADGEFVIPADVVSHLGNGSSKAGAKQLYSMMDRIRQARTGTKKQGKEVNPRRFMPA
jgi:hypothetical protein